MIATWTTSQNLKKKNNAPPPFLNLKINFTFCFRTSKFALHANVFFKRIFLLFKVAIFPSKI